MNSTNSNQEYLIEKVKDKVMKHFMDMGIDEMVLTIERMILAKVKEVLSADEWLKFKKNFKFQQ